MERQTVALRLALPFALALGGGAQAETLGVVVQVDVREPAALRVGEGLRGRLASLGWRVESAPEGPHCVVRGQITWKPAGSLFSVSYQLDAVSESGAKIAALEGRLDKVRGSDARDEIVNVFFSRVQAARQGHPMANAIQIQGVNDDAEVQALKVMMAAAAGVPAVQSEHFSNGELELTVDARVPARAMADRLTEARAGGKALQIEYAGVDLMVAHLQIP
jgi:FAD/FMN-containing dehydrogenase